MGILVSVIVGVALTLPISSAAICAALGLTGLAGGAAVAGICKQVNTVVRGNPFAEAASSEERLAIEDAMTGTCSSAFSVGVSMWITVCARS